MLTRLDKLLIIFLLSVALLGLLIVRYLTQDADTVVVQVSGKEALRASLNKDQNLSVEGPLGITEVEIKDKQVRVLDSPCKRKICVESGWIQKSYQHIICVPNQVVIRLEGGRDREEIDGITE